jgi:hypothetical protein
MFKSPLVKTVLTIVLVGVALKFIKPMLPESISRFLP